MQDNWQFCPKCKGLSFFGNGRLGSCPAGGEHSHLGSGNYELAGHGDGVAGQPGWRHCGQCEGLFFAGNGRLGHCAAGGTHVDEGGDYVLATSGAGQSGWHHCDRCEGLFFADDESLGRCPATGGTQPHHIHGPGSYVLTILEAPAAPPPVRSVEVMRTSAKSFEVVWSLAPAQPGAGTAEVFDVYESTPPGGADRFVGTVRAGTHQLATSVWGDAFPDLGHCYVVYARSRLGCSPGVRNCSPPPSPDGTPPGTATLVLAVESDGDIVELRSARWLLNKHGERAETVPIAANQVNLFHRRTRVVGTETWQVTCELEVAAFAAEADPPQVPLQISAGPWSFSWDPSGRPSIVGRLVHRSATDGRSADTTLQIGFD